MHYVPSIQGILFDIGSDRIRTESTPTLKENAGVLVVGGTGQLGSYHVQHLSAAGEPVIVLARPTSSFERLE